MSKRKTEPDNLTVAVTIARFARSVDMSENAIHNAIARGEIKVFRVGRAVRIPVTEFARLGLPTPVFTGGAA